MRYSRDPGAGGRDAGCEEAFPGGRSHAAEACCGGTEVPSGGRYYLRGPLLRPEGLEVTGQMK